MVEGPLEAEVGSSITISRGHLQADGQIVWRNGNEFGVKFDSPAMPELWIGTPNVLTFRSSSHSVDKSPEHQAEMGKVISNRIQEEMAYVARMLDAVADILSFDPFLRLKHAMQLQQLCIGSQMILELSSVLVSEDKFGAIEMHVTGPMRQRLLRRPN